MYLLPDIFLPTDCLEQQLLRCLRGFLNLNVYSSFETFTDDVQAAILKELEKFCGEIKGSFLFDLVNIQVINSPLQFQALSKLMPNKNWNFPKMHLHMHMLQDIFNKGATKHYSTKTFEAMHKLFKELYLLTNFKNVAPQVCVIYMSTKQENLLDV